LIHFSEFFFVDIAFFEDVVRGVGKKSGKIGLYEEGILEGFRRFLLEDRDDSLSVGFIIL